jgi:hypothetical protein
MAHKVDMARVQEELVAAVKQGDEAHARELVAQLGAGPRGARAALETMLNHPEALVRQAAAFGLGELGGAASAKRLEEQLALEDARGDYDGASVIEEIIRALGRTKEAGARASLVRRLGRVVAGKPERSDVNELAEALWRKRHPELIPAVRASLEKLTLPAPHGLHGLLVLLEKSPEELDSWARDLSVPLNYKRVVLAVAEEDVPAPLVPVLRAFLATAQAVSDTPRMDGEAESYCERLFSVLLQDREHFILAAPQEMRSALRDVALKVIQATSPDPSVGAAVILKLVGRPEDAAFLEAHCPAEPVLAKVFRDAAQELRGLRKN